MSRKPVDDIIQRNLNSCKSTIYYKLYPDIYKRDSPLLNNYTKAQQAELTHPYIFESSIVFKKRFSILAGIIGKYGAIPYFGSIEEKLVFDVRKKILLNLLS